MTIGDGNEARWVLVTGGSRGIGGGIVELLSTRGFHVSFTYRDSGETADALAQRLTAAGARVDSWRCDGTDDAAVADMAKHMLAERGAPYAIVNNAGITRDGLLARMSVGDWDSVVGTNLRSMFLTTQAFMGAMIGNGGGSIVQISSVTAERGNPGQTNYAATKAGMLGFTRSLALDVARFNVRVNSVAPGFIETEMTSQMPEPSRKKIRDLVPLRRMGTTKEVASLVSYLISDEAAYITGQTFTIDGGLSA